MDITGFFHPKRLELPLSLYYKVVNYPNLLYFRANSIISRL